MNEKKKASEESPLGRSYLIKFVFAPIVLLLICLFLQRKGWITLNPQAMGLLFVTYWLVALAIAGWMWIGRRGAKLAKLSSPLIELQLSNDLRARLAAFAAARHQKPTVVAFELLDCRIPRFEQDEARSQARRDNEHLVQPSGRSTMLVAVTSEILKRLFLLSGASEEDRRLWRSQINETALRILREALEQQESMAE